MLKAPVDYSPFDLKGLFEDTNLLGRHSGRMACASSSGLDLIAEKKTGWGPGPGADGYEMPIY